MSGEEIGIDDVDVSVLVKRIRQLLQKVLKCDQNFFYVTQLAVRLINLRLFKMSRALLFLWLFKMSRALFHRQIGVPSYPSNCRYSTKCWELDSFPVSRTLCPRPENARYSGLVLFAFDREVFA